MFFMGSPMCPAATAVTLLSWMKRATRAWWLPGVPSSWETSQWTVSVRQDVMVPSSTFAMATVGALPQLWPT